MKLSSLGGDLRRYNARLIVFGVLEWRDYYSRIWCCYSLDLIQQPRTSLGAVRRTVKTIVEA